MNEPEGKKTTIRHYLVPIDLTGQKILNFSLNFEGLFFSIEQTQSSN